MNYLIIIIILLIILSILLRRNIYPKDLLERTLDKDGFVVLPNILDKDQIEKYLNLSRGQNITEIKHDIISNSSIIDRIQNKTGLGYEFQDYIWVIQKSLVHTCHRDNNGISFNEKQKHESYTILFYLTDTDTSNLGVIPGSHKGLLYNGINLTDPTIHLKVPAGSAILFNANLVHVGEFNQQENNPRIQMKVTHFSDRPYIDYYEDFNKYVNTENRLPMSIRKIQKHITCQFPVLSDMTQSTNIRTARGSSQGAHIPLSQKIFSLLFYGDWNYYDLKDGK